MTTEDDEINRKIKEHERKLFGEEFDLKVNKTKMDYSADYNNLSAADLDGEEEDDNAKD